MVEHPLHLIQFIGGNKAIKYNSLLKKYNRNENLFPLHLFYVHVVHFSFHNNFQYTHI